MRNGFKKFNVTFVENKKYNPMTRVITVEAKDDVTAINVIASQFGSFKYHKELQQRLPSNSKIKIIDISEIQDNLIVDVIEPQNEAE